MLEPVYLWICLFKVQLRFWIKKKRTKTWRSLKITDLILNPCTVITHSSTKQPVKTSPWVRMNRKYASHVPITRQSDWHQIIYYNIILLYYWHWPWQTGTYESTHGQWSKWSIFTHIIIGIIRKHLIIQYCFLHFSFTICFNSEVSAVVRWYFISMFVVHLLSKE